MEDWRDFDVEAEDSLLIDSRTAASAPAAFERRKVRWPGGPEIGFDSLGSARMS